MTRAIAVLVSGGLDSAALVSDLLRRYDAVWPIAIRQDLAWEPVERFWLKRFLAAIRTPRLKPLHVLAVPMKDVYGNHWSVTGKRVPGARSADPAVYLPGRNLTLTVKAAVFCALHQIPVLAIGSLGHNPFPDASPSFFATWSRSIARGMAFPFRIDAPYRRRSKASVIRAARGVPLHLSFSCIAPAGRRHCGHCNKCAERRKAFRQAHVEDLTEYAHE